MTQIKNAPRVLAIDDELLQRKLILQQLTALGLIGEAAETAAQAMDILRSREFDVVLLDVQMDEMSGLEILPQIRNLEDAPEVVMLTLDASLESGVQAMREGAYDYLIKPAASDALDIIIRRATEKRRLVRQNASLRDYVNHRRQPSRDEELVYLDPQMRAIVEQATAIARLNSTVLITGESGTGKDVLARHIHQRSPRAATAMVSVNCGAMPETLFESEFFGYEKGAFSGAVTSKRGLLEAADGATLFLDEIGEMPLNLQVKLLRFLESGEFRRVGGTRDLFADTRLIAATNRDLTMAIREGRFRSDLYYRLNVIQLPIPPLRTRREDIPALTDFFLDLYRRQFNQPELRLSPAARRKINEYDFPGNIRELKNIIERAAALADDQMIEAENILTSAAQTASGEHQFPAAQIEREMRHSERLAAVLDVSSEREVVKLSDLEREYILTILKVTNGNRERAAALLGISKRTIYRRLRDYS